MRRCSVGLSLEFVSFDDDVVSMGLGVDGPGSVRCEPDTSERVAISLGRW